MINGNLVRIHSCQFPVYQKDKEGRKKGKIVITEIIVKKDHPLVLLCQVDRLADMPIGSLYTAIVEYFEHFRGNTHDIQEVGVTSKIENIDCSYHNNNNYNFSGNFTFKEETIFFRKQERKWFISV